jgi:hypothetical protein
MILNYKLLKNEYFHELCSVSFWEKKVFNHNEYLNKRVLTDNYTIKEIIYNKVFLFLF